MLAGELALARVDVAIVERRANQDLPGSRAGGLHSRTIEILDQRGIVERFLAQGQIAQVASFAMVTLDLSDFPTRHNYGLALWQERIERILAGWVDELAVPIYRSLPTRPSGTRSPRACSGPPWLKRRSTAATNEPRPCARPCPSCAKLDEARKRYGAMMSGLDIRYDLGTGHPLLGRRMPDLDVVTASGPRRLFSLLHDARPVLLDLGEPGALDIAPWADRVPRVDARLRGCVGAPGARPRPC